jgi:hypothetical protein
MNDSLAGIGDFLEEMMASWDCPGLGVGRWRYCSIWSRSCVLSGGQTRRRGEDYDPQGHDAGAMMAPTKSYRQQGIGRNLAL